MVKMKFGIKKDILVDKTNVFGKVLYANEVYKVYRRSFFGLFRFYVRIQPSAWEMSHEVRFSYVPMYQATCFYKRADAQALIDAIYATPDKFVRYRYK